MKHLIVIALIVVFFTSPAIAGGEAPFTPIDAQKLIDDCRKKYQPYLDTGITSKMREGSAKIVGCLKQIVINQSSEMLNPSLNPKEKVIERLDMASVGIQKMYWAIFNEHKGCPAYCGTHTHTFHLAIFADVLEDMIKTMISQRNEAKY